MAHMMRIIEKARNRVATGIALVVVIGLGLSSRAGGGLLPQWIANNAGDALWTVAAFLTLACFFPRWSSLRLGLAAFIISVAVELSQLIDWDWLNVIRRTLPGRLLLGSGFLWADLVRYFAGAAGVTIVDWWWHRLGKSTCKRLD